VRSLPRRLQWLTSPITAGFQGDSLRRADGANPRIQKSAEEFAESPFPGVRFSDEVHSYCITCSPSADKARWFSRAVRARAKHFRGQSARAIVSRLTSTQFLDFRRKVPEMHYRGQACPADLAGVGEFAVAVHRAFSDQPLEFDRQRHQPADPRDASFALCRGLGSGTWKSWNG
jgi:hypothetical protein